MEVMCPILARYSGNASFTPTTVHDLRAEFLLAQLR
jgi:hypothetical protein